MGVTLGTIYNSGAAGWSTFTPSQDTAWAAASLYPAAWAYHEGTSYQAGYTGPGGYPSATGNGTRFIYASPTGSDSNPGTFSAPKQNLMGHITQALNGAVASVRSGYPDWILLKAGATWTGDSFGYVNKTGVAAVDGNGVAQQPMLFGNYDSANHTLPPPGNAGVGRAVIAHDGNAFHGCGIGCNTGGVLDYCVITGIEFYAYTRDPSNASGAPSNWDICCANWLTPPYNSSSNPTLYFIMFEDCHFRYFSEEIGFQWSPQDGTNLLQGWAVIRRCVFDHTYLYPTGNSTAIYSVSMKKLTIHECVFDRNGWLNSYVPQNNYCHNVYVDDTVDFRGNWMSYDASGSQFRGGGDIVDNAWSSNMYCLAFTGVSFVTGNTLTNSLKYNVFLEGNSGTYTTGTGSLPGSTYVMDKYAGYHGTQDLGTLDVSYNIVCNMVSAGASTLSYNPDNGVSNINFHDNITYAWGGEFVTSHPNAVYLLGINTFGSGYSPGRYWGPEGSPTWGIPTTGGSGTGCTLDITVASTGSVSGVQIYCGAGGAQEPGRGSGGQNYVAVPSDILTPSGAWDGPGSGATFKVSSLASVVIGTVDTTVPGSGGPLIPGHNVYDPSGTVFTGAFSAPARNSNTYAASLSGLGITTKDQLIALMYNQRKGNWDVRLTANAFNNYIRAGFNQAAYPAAGGTLTLSPSTVPDGVVGALYVTQNFSASGGTAPYTWTHSGTVPPGLNFNDAAATLSGTPTTAGNYSFSITANDSAAGTTGPTSYSIKVFGTPITISPATLPSPATVGVLYPSTPLTASGGLGPFTFAVTGGLQPPPGISLVGNTIQGTPTAQGSYTFTVTATDSLGATGPRTYTIQVNASTAGPPTIRFVHHKV